MQDVFLIFGNVYIPITAGIFFFIYALYFRAIRTSHSGSYRAFEVFLLSFAVFLIGRPAQLLLGAHPVPLSIVCVRFMLLCGVIAPSFVLATSGFDLFETKRHYKVIGAGVVLGIVYVAFTLLSTTGSYPAFKLGDVTANDAYTPSFAPPFYGREVTIAIQVILGLALSAFSVMNMVNLWRDYRKKKTVQRKFILINAGALIFAVSFMIGSYLRQWWVFYAASILSAVMTGGGVLIDIKELRTKIEGIIPILRDDLTRNTADSPQARERVFNMLKIIGKNRNFDTFMTVGTGMGNGSRNQAEPPWNSPGHAAAIIERKIRTLVPEGDYLIMPLENGIIGICLAIQGRRKRNASFAINLAESIRKDAAKAAAGRVWIGIGRSHTHFADLPLSYREALIALDYARGSDHAGFISFESIRTIAEREGVSVTLEPKGAFGEGMRREYTETHIAKAASFIDANYKRNLSLKQIADHAFLSPSHLQHLFKSETGRSVMQYLNEARMDRAKALLKEARLNISQIAFEIGFNDASYFSKAFKKFYGVAPTDFLRQE
jgi:AraC-like DNA-binding protein